MLYRLERQRRADQVVQQGGGRGTRLEPDRVDGVECRGAASGDGRRAASDASSGTSRSDAGTPPELPAHLAVSDPDRQVDAGDAGWRCAIGLRGDVVSDRRAVRHGTGDGDGHGPFGGTGRRGGVAEPIA